MLRGFLHIVLTLSLLIASIATGAARAASPTVDHVVICSGHATYIAYVDEDGEPTAAPNLCPSCILHVLAPLPATVAAQARSLGGVAVAAPKIATQNAHPWPSSITPRGPPVRSI